MNTTSATTSLDETKTDKDKEYLEAAYKLYAITSLIHGDYRDGAKDRIMKSDTKLTEPNTFNDCVDEVYDYFGVDINEVPSPNKINQAKRVTDGFITRRSTDRG